MIPKIDLLKDENFEMKLHFHSCRMSIINSLRRIILSEVPSLAFDQIWFCKNTGVMNEDMLAHRISMIPLYCPNIEMLKFPEECSCEFGCSNCEIEYFLNVKNTEGESEMGVYCSDLKTAKNSNIVKYTNRENQKGILLTRLSKNQELQLKAKAIKGIGGQHSKWSSTNVCHFQKQKDGSVIFHVEVNQNANCIDVVKKAAEILYKKLEMLSTKIHMYHTEDDSYEVPFDDTVLNILIDYMIENYDNLSVCFYKRGHFLQDTKSKIVFHNHENNFTLEEKNIMLRTTIYIIQSTIHFLECSLNKIKWGVDM